MPCLPVGGDGLAEGRVLPGLPAGPPEIAASATGLLTGLRNPATGRFMGAVDIAGFREPELVYQQMQETFAKIRGLKKAPGRDRIYIPGEIEATAEEENRSLGVVVSPAALNQIKRLNDEMK